MANDRVPSAPRPSPAAAVQRWLSRDYAPLDGRVRFAFYALVLVVGARYFAVTVPVAVRGVPAELYDGAGLFALVVDDRATALTLVETLRFPLLLALALSAVGLGGRLPLLCSGLGSFLMVGAFLSGTGTGHVWHVAVFAMVVLGLTHRPTAWSLDAVLARRWRWYPFGRTGRDHSSIGLKLILLYAVFTLFAGGCAKLLEGGWRWADGESIRFFLIEHGAPKGAIGRALTDLVVDHVWLAVAISVLTIAIELGAVITLAAPGFRLPYFLLLAAGFHLATYLLMLPEFFPQLVTYVLVVEWARVDWRRPWIRRPVAAVPTPPARRPTLAVVAAGTLILVLGVSVAARIEWYPLTNIPMYSSYVDGTEISGVPTATFADEALLCDRADELRSRTRPWYARFHVADRLQLRAAPGGPVGIEEVARQAGDPPRFWLDELAGDVLDELPCADGTLVVGAPMPRTERAVRALRDRLPVGSVGVLALIYPFDDGTDVTLVTVPGDGPP